MAPADLSKWGVGDVTAWLEGLGLPAELQEAFRKNAVDGDDLKALTDEDLMTQLGCTPLQARKIRQHLNQLGVAPPAASSMPSCATAAPSASSASPSASARSVHAGAAAEPDPRTCFEAADLQRYQQLKQHVAELQGMQPAAKVSQATSHLETVQRALAAAQAALPPLQHALAVEHEHEAKYSGEKFSLTKFVTTQHHKDVKLAEAHAKAEGLQAQLAAAQAAVAARQGELEEARKQLGAWQAKASELGTTQRQLEDHVAHIFSTPAWRASPRQTELADAMQALQGQAAESARGAQTYGRGTQLLGESSQLLQQALQGLQQTQMFTMMEMGFGMGGGFGRPVPGHLFDDLIEMQIIQRSNDAIAVAAGKTMEARTLLPGLPQVDDRVLHAAKMGIFQNILFGGVGSDVIEMAMVQRSKRDVEDMQRQVQAALAWAQSNSAVYQHKVAELKAQVAAKRTELDGFRSAALQAALA